MRKIVLIAVVALVALTAYGKNPKSFVRRADLFLASNELEKAKEDLDSALQYPENLIWSQTWLTLGNYYYAISKTSDIESLKKAVDSYVKANELDVKGSTMQEVNYIKMPGMANTFRETGLKCFDTKDYICAFESFRYLHLINQTPGMLTKDANGNVAKDSAVIFYTGIAALNANLSDSALRYLQMAYSIKHKPTDAIIYMKKIYIENKKDTVGAMELLKTAYNNKPAESGLLIELLQMYLYKGQNDIAFEYLKKGMQNDPKNDVLYLAEGILFEKLGKPDNALESYLKAIELNPMQTNGYTNIGAIYLEKANTKFSEADKIPLKERAKTDAVIAEAYVFLKKALPYYEKSSELLESKNIDVLKTLKQVYYKLKQKDSSLEKRYNEIVALLDNLI